MSVGWCPQCGRKLTNMMVNCQGSCRKHGLRWAEWNESSMVVDSETEEVLGFFHGVDADTLDISVRSFAGEVTYMPRHYVEVRLSSEIQGGEW